MVKLTPQEQASFRGAEPHVYQPASGAWGRRASTIVTLRKAKELTVRRALLPAWRNTAPQRLIDELDR